MNSASGPPLPGSVRYGAWIDALDRSHRLAIVAMAIAGFIHVALIVRRDAPSEDAVVAGLGWLLATLCFASAKGTAASRRNVGIAGLGVLLLGLAQAARLETCDLWFPKALPFFLFGGVLLQASSPVAALRCHWRSIAILVTMVPVPHVEAFLESIRCLTLLHAKAAAFLLYYLGYDIVSHGGTLTLPAGTVDVHPGCSGQPLMFLLMRIGLILCLAVPVRWGVRLTIFLATIAMGGITGVIRIATLAAAVQNPEWFKGIHGPFGGSFFTTLGILLYAPFLIPFEKPLADLLQRCRTTRMSVSTESAERCLWISIAALLGFTCAFFMLERMGDRGSIERTELTQWDTPMGNRVLRVPEALGTDRFGLVKSAQLWRSTTALGNWKVLVCPISNGLVGPRELVLNGDWDCFLCEQFPGVFPLLSDSVWKKIKTNADGNGIGIARTSKGVVAIAGVNPDGETFFDSSDYATTQKAALSRWQTWRRWLIAGKPLKDFRYRLVILSLEIDRKP